MPVIDPRVRFIFGLVITIAIGLSQGTVSLTDMIPAAWIKPVIGWAGFIAFLGSSIQTTFAGLATTTASRIASAAADPAVRGMTVDPKVRDIAIEAAAGNAFITTREK